MRTKHHIITYIQAQGLFKQLPDIVRLADIWSDQIIVIYTGPWVMEREATKKVSESLLEITPILKVGGLVQPDRYLSYAAMASYVDRDGHDIPHPYAVVGLEATWIISDPHIVRDAVELNTGKSLFAKRYFMIDDENYRADGIYQPIALPVIYPYLETAHFTSEANTAPIYAWTSPRRGEAPFSILDYQMHNIPVKGGTTRMFEGMIPV